MKCCFIKQFCRRPSSSESVDHSRTQRALETVQRHGAVDRPWSEASLGLTGGQQLLR